MQCFLFLGKTNKDFHEIFGLPKDAFHIDLEIKIAPGSAKYVERLESYRDAKSEDVLITFTTDKGILFSILGNLKEFLTDVEKLKINS